MSDNSDAPVTKRNAHDGAVAEQRTRGTIFPGGGCPPSSSASEWATPSEPPQSNGSSPASAGRRSPPPPGAELLIDSSDGAVGGGGGDNTATAPAAETQEPWTETPPGDAGDELTPREPSCATAAATAAGVALSSTGTVVYAESGRIYRPAVVEEEPDDYRRCLSNQLFGPAECRCSDRWSVAGATVDSDAMDCEEDSEDISATFGQQQRQQQQMSLPQSNGDHNTCFLVDACPENRLSTTVSTTKAADSKTGTSSEGGVSATPGEEGAVPLKEDDAASSSSPQNASPNLRSRSFRKSNSRRIGCLRPGGGGGGGGVGRSASPVLHRSSPSESGADEMPNGDDGEDDEDDGVYSETFRYSSYKYIGEDIDDDNDVTGIDSPQDGVLSEEKLPEKRHDGRVGCSRSDSKLYDRYESKNHHRSFSVATADTKGSKESVGKTLSRKIIKRHIGLGAEIYQMPSERVYEVERTLILKKPDSVASFGFHLLGQNPMVISTIEPGSIAEFNGAQIGDRLVTVNGADVIKASQSTLIDIISRSPTCLELGVASGFLSRDICICSGYLNLKPDGIMRNWKRRWCQLKYDGFLYYYKADNCSSPLGAISMSNYVIIRGSDCGRGSVFKLVKYGQKTYYIQADSDEEMNWWAGNINMATSKTNSFCDTWLDISSHNVLLPALSIKRPECHGYLTKVGNRNTNWRRRYCILKSACLYYYKDQTSSTAKGVAHFHGYSIEEETMYHRRFGFMAVPPVAQMRTFHFTAENETDKQRWMAALKNSIGKWVKVDDD